MWGGLLLWWWNGGGVGEGSRGGSWELAGEAELRLPRGVGEVGDVPLNQLEDNVLEVDQHECLRICLLCLDSACGVAFRLSLSP